MKIKNIIYGSIPLLLIILGITFCASGYSFSEFPSALVAWGTLMLAFATFMLIRHSKEQESQRREDELAKGKRDRKVQLLNDIINWAGDLASCSFLEKTQERHPAGNLLQRHRYFASKETYIRKSVLFFANEELSNALSRILDNKGSLRNAIDGLHALDIIDIESESKKALKEVETDTVKLAILSLELSKLSISAASKWIDLMPIGQKLYEDVTDLIEHASNIKIKLISEF